MTDRRVVVVAGREVTIAVDGPVSAGNRVWALVRGRAVDELTGRPPRSTVMVTAAGRGLVPRVAAGGLLGVVGEPVTAFSQLATQSYPVELTIRCPHYVMRRVGTTVPADPAFPGVFTPRDLGDIELRREPTVIRGRVVTVGPLGATGVVGATVALTGLWRRLPPASLPGAADPPDVVALQPPLMADRTVAAGQLRTRAMAPAAVADKALEGNVPAGAVELQSSDRIGLAAADVVLIDAAQPDRAEFATLTVVAGSTVAAAPARLSLAHPTANEHRTGAVLRKVLPQPPGIARALTVAVAAGDTTVFLASLAGLPVTGSIAAVSGGAAPDEYREIARYEATTNPDGYFRLPPLSRVAQVRLRASAPGLTPVVATIAPDYTVPENRIDLVLT